jgi:ubiquinone/menaquinone biosynthesis C-methylase UbiE
MNINSIDWNQLWKEQRAKRVHKEESPQYWDKRAPSFADHVVKTDYSNAFLKIIKPKRSWSVLDMACGGGTLSIPLAYKVKEITAVDFSNAMLDILEKEAHKRKLKNIKTINAAWTDNWAEKNIGVYDIAIASRALSMDDIQSALLKLINCARKGVYISIVSGEGPRDRKILEAVGRKFNPHVDYIYAYNLLYQMGIRANVDFITDQKSKKFENHESALDSFRWMVESITEQEEELLKKFLKEHLIRYQGKWILDYEKKVQWAVLWWEK